MNILNRLLAIIKNRVQKDTKIDVKPRDVLVECVSIDENEHYYLNPPRLDIKTQYKKKVDEFIQLCEYGINNEHYKSTVYFNLLFAFELILKRQLKINNNDNIKSHYINKLFYKLNDELNDNRYSPIYEMMDALLKKDGLSLENLDPSNLKYNYNIDETIVIKNDIPNQKINKSIMEIIKCIKTIEN